MTLRKAALLLLCVFLGTCNQAIMVAPPNSTMQMIANPPFIAAHGDVSQIAALINDGTGQPVADGTVVQFFTNLGRIQEQGKTNDGVVRVNLISDSRSGIATVTAVSGGSVTGPGPTPSPTPAPTPAATPVPPATGGGLASVMSITGGSAVSAAQVSASVTVTIGSERPVRVLLTANPPRLTTGTATTLLAQVFGESGNPTSNVPVIFQITATTVQARLDSGGQAPFTDNDGRASDTLRTNSLVAGSITVRATTANGIASNDVVVPVFIN